MTRRLAPRGFTLAETVIAVAILGMMGAMVFGTFGRTLEGRERAEQITSRYHQIRQAMLRMSREIEMAFLSDHRDCSDPRTDTIFKSHDESGGMRLDFTAFAHYKTQADANESDQDEISYYVGKDPDPDPDADHNQTVLLRREDDRIDEEPTEGGVEQVLCEGVTSLRFEFYNEKDDRWEEEWDSKNSDFRGRVPMFVAIHLKALAPDGKEEEFVTKTRVFLRQPIFLTGAKCLDD